MADHTDTGQSTDEPTRTSEGRDGMVTDTDVLGTDTGNDTIHSDAFLESAYSAAYRQDPIQHFEMEPLEALPAAESMLDNILESEDKHHATDQSEYERLEDILGEGQNKYELRRQARESKPAFSRTWIDDDRTGCYDPVEEQRRLRQRPKRPNPLLKCAFRPWDLDESDGENEAPRERVLKPVPKLEVTLVFKSEAGKAAFQEHVRSLPVERELSEELFSERRLRRRDSAVGLSHLHTPKATKKRRLPDDLPEDLTGHPIARGCWECLTIGIRCPLLDDDRAWPCQTCLDDDNECELIQPPTFKRACEHCKSRRFGCSYTYTLDHDGPCEECSRTGWKCVAGPAKESIRERLTYDRDWENDPWQAPKPPKVKKATSCQGCRERGQLCSFSAGDKGDVCTACDMANRECVREPETSPIGRKRKRGQTKPKPVFEEDDSISEGEQSGKKVSWGPDVFGPSVKVNSDPIVIGSSSHNKDSDDTPPSPMKPKSGSTLKEKAQTKTNIKNKDKQRKPEGTLETISTKFAHPILFNHEGEEPCHFCFDIRFGMFGLGAAEVEVVNWHDGRGLDEVSGGHREQGIENTRMCVSCTTQRVPIIMCEKHELQPLEGGFISAMFGGMRVADGVIDAVTGDVLLRDAALTNLLNGTTTGEERWCSICPTLARYQCCTAGMHGKGCGLMLCETCAVSVVDSEGDLEKALKVVEDDTGEERVLGLRADYEFLKQHGLLMRFVLWESQ